MLTIKINDELTYTVSFSRKKEKFESSNWNGLSILLPITTCKIYEYASRQNLAGIHQGVALLSPRDEHNELKGKKVALASAVRKLSGPYKAEIWNEFINQWTVTHNGKFE